MFYMCVYTSKVIYTIYILTNNAMQTIKQNKNQCFFMPHTNGGEESSRNKKAGECSWKPLQRHALLAEGVT